MCEEPYMVAPFLHLKKKKKQLTEEHLSSWMAS